MKIERFRNKYRVRKMYKGKTYTLLFDEKPTQKEVLLKLSEMMENLSDHDSLSFQKAAENYIESKTSVLSPATVRGYSNIIKKLSPDFLKTNIYNINIETVQKEINEVARTKSAKTVRNYNALISSVIGFYRKGVQFNVTLPQKVRNEPYIPTDEDVKRILEELKGTDYEIAFRLACYGLRRSEICALTIEDLDGNILTINKALVPNEKREWVLKTTKTAESTRQIYIDDDLANLIRSKGVIYDSHPGTLTDYMARLEKRLGIPHFSLHKLRHYYASTAHTLGIPDAYIMKAGGWKTDNVMKSIYRHAQKGKDMEAMEIVSKHISNL